MRKNPELSSAFASLTQNIETMRPQTMLAIMQHVGAGFKKQTLAGHEMEAAHLMERIFATVDGCDDQGRWAKVHAAIECAKLYKHLGEKTVACDWVRLAEGAHEEYLSHIEPLKEIAELKAELVEPVMGYHKAYQTLANCMHNDGIEAIG